MHTASLEEVRAFARNLSARLAGSFVVLSPKQDWDVGNDDGIHCAGEEIHDATPYHLVTQHPMRRPMPELVIGYHHQPYMDFTSVQTGIGPDMDGVAIELATASRCTIEWLSTLYQEPPTRPIINLEGVYEDDYIYLDVSGRMLVMARRGGYMSFLCGAYGFTSSTYGVWAWGRAVDWGRDDAEDWRSAMKRPYATFLQYLARFFGAIEWWRLEPRAELILNQADEWDRRMLLSGSTEGDLAVAFLPDNPSIQIDVTSLSAPVTATWFDPLSGEYGVGSADASPPTEPRTFHRPADWTEAVLLLTATR